MFKLWHVLYLFKSNFYCTSVRTVWRQWLRGMKQPSYPSSSSSFCQRLGKTAMGGRESFSSPVQLPNNERQECKLVSKAWGPAHIFQGWKKEEKNMTKSGKMYQTVENITHTCRCLSSPHIDFFPFPKHEEQVLPHTLVARLIMRKDQIKCKLWCICGRLHNGEAPLLLLARD